MYEVLGMCVLVVEEYRRESDGHNKEDEQHLEESQHYRNHIVDSGRKHEMMYQE